MGRSRSPQRRERHRSRERGDIDRERRGVRERHRSRSLSPRLRNRSPRRRRSPRRKSRSPRRREPYNPPLAIRERKEKTSALPKFLLDRPPITDKDLEGKTEEEVQMMKLMGFANFDTSKGKHVPGNNVSAVHVIHKRKYRQYMNRKGGFNRPLDFVA